MIRPSSVSAEAQGVEQINTAIGTMDTLTRDNASGAEKSAARSAQLLAQVRMLSEAVYPARSMYSRSTKTI